MKNSGKPTASRIFRLEGFGASKGGIDGSKFGERALDATDATRHPIDLIPFAKG